eukprot:scaffold160552_cov21-Tisochrysis_lutea.AAC.1
MSGMQGPTLCHCHFCLHINSEWHTRGSTCMQNPLLQWLPFKGAAQRQSEGPYPLPITAATLGDIRQWFLKAGRACMNCNPCCSAAYVPQSTPAHLRYLQLVLDVDGNSQIVPIMLWPSEKGKGKSTPAKTLHFEASIPSQLLVSTMFCCCTGLAQGGFTMALLLPRSDLEKLPCLRPAAAEVSYKELATAMKAAYRGGVGLDLRERLEVHL